MKTRCVQSPESADSAPALVEYLSAISGLFTHWEVGVTLFS
jgi:hypothetical protein